MKQPNNLSGHGLTRRISSILVLSGVWGCQKEQAGEACSLETIAAQQTAEEALGSSFTSDPPRGPELSWFVLHQPSALASFRYAKLTYGALGVGDVDGDGKDDLVATGLARKLGVFLNRGGFEFEDKSSASGLSERGGSTLALGDLDNDGDLDLVTSERLTISVFANDGTGIFSQKFQLTTAPEVPANQLLLVDFDNDGWLDIFGSYPPGLSAFDRSGPNKLFWNQGELRFADVSDTVGVPVDGNSWASGAADFDDDGDQDIIVANDGNVIDYGDRSEATTTVEFPYNGALVNQGGHNKTVLDRAEALGLEGPYSSMGVVFEDVDRNGDFEIFITDFGTNKLMKRGASGAYEDVAAELGLDPAQRVGELCNADTETPDCLLVSWGAAFRDFDLDGEDDVLVLNHEADTGVAQPLQLFKKDGDQYQEYSLAVPNVTAHALVTADFDGDGDLDFAASTVGERILVFENVVGDRCEGNWLGVKLEGTSSNRQGIGATVSLEQNDGQIQKRLITSGGVAHGSPLSETHFGLGEHTANSLTVRWPSGKISTFDSVPERARVLLREPH